MPPRLRPSSLTSTGNVIPQFIASDSPLLPFLLPLPLRNSLLALSRNPSHPPSSSSRQFSTSKPAAASSRYREFVKTPGRRNGFIEWMRDVAPLLNNPAPLRNIPTYMSYKPQPLPTLKGTSGSTPKREFDEQGNIIDGPKRAKRPKADEVDWERAMTEMSLSPFPTNPSFQAHPVISTEFREQIYLRIKAGRSVRRVSAELNCELERVAAVVRMKEIERMWGEQNRPLCTAMQNRVHALMPVSQWKALPQHESITDMRIHPATNNQLFLAVPESMPFSRKDAGAALGILPADQRMPHSELIEVERMRLQGKNIEEMVEVERQREEAEFKAAQEKQARVAAKKAAETVVETDRFEFRLKPAVTGHVGFRYGVPHDDRKRGVVKIPTRVVV
ncbi:37S ribosomal protein S35 [Drechslerella dactyloides]|uniref:37S ribosomal protein S35 n=1 Tax=Drechslerella dactyloides TaxID=74499 RepID=A0AAD6NGN6_DREDA|nr:37S ribosomal protein S35 [Drechslerella dactyloides]